MCMNMHMHMHNIFSNEEVNESPQPPPDGVPQGRPWASALTPAGTAGNSMDSSNARLAHPARECCKQFHVEVENVFEREAATRRAAVAVEGDVQQQAGESAGNLYARDIHRAEQPQPGESGLGWAVRTLYDVQNHGWRPSKRHCGALWVRLCVAHSSSLLFYTYRGETCGSFKSRVMKSAKMMLGAHWRLIFAGRRLTDACKLSAYNIEHGNMVHAVPSSRPLRRRTVMKYSS